MGKTRTADLPVHMCQPPSRRAQSCRLLRIHQWTLVRTVQGLLAASAVLLSGSPEIGQRLSFR